MDSVRQDLANWRTIPENGPARPWWPVPATVFSEEVAMHTFHLRRIAATCCLVLLLGCLPSWGAERERGPRPAPLKAESIARSVFARFFEFAEKLLSSGGGTFSPPPAEGGASDSGSSLDPNG